MGLVVALALPSLLAGPEIMADDFVWLRNAEFLGWWDAGSTRQVGRPGAFALYALTFGLIGPHPLVLAFVQIGLWIAAAVAVYLLLRAALGEAIAFATTFVWLLAPTHTSLELWASTSQAWVALILLATGLRWVSFADPASWRRRLGWACLVLCGSFYEVVIPVVPVGLALLDRRRGGAWRWRPLGLGVLAVLPALAWSLVMATVYPDELPTTEGDWPQHLAGALAMGLHPDGGAAQALGLGAVAIGAALVVWRRATSTTGVVLVAGGLAVALAGAVAGLRSYIVPVGIGNRLTAASGVGAALVWVGAWLLVAPRLSATAKRGLAAMLVVLALAFRADHLTDWFDVADETAALVPQISAAAASSDGPLVLDESPARGRLAYGLLDGWNTTAAAQDHLDDARVVVLVRAAQHPCVLTGPPAEEPLAQYGQRPDQLDGSCRP